MKMADLEDRVRRMHRSEPSADLRARVLSREPVVERPVTWTARVASAAERAPQAGVVETSRLGWRAWRRSGVLVALSVLLIAGSCAGFDVLEGHRIDAEIARFEAKYGSLDLSTLLVPAVPDADNRARVVRAAAALAVGMPELEYHYIDFQLPAAVPPRLRAFAESNRDAIRLADGVRTRRQSNWEMDYRTEMVPYQPIRILADAIFLTALLDLEGGQADDATAMVVTGLGIAASFRQEPDSLPQVMRTSVGWRQIEVIREIVSHSAPTAGALEELARALAENRTPDPAQIAILSDLKRGNSILARMENGDIDPGTATYIYPMTWPSWPKVLLRPAARIGRPFVRAARLRLLEYGDRVLDLRTSPPPHARVPEFPSPQRWALVDRLTEKFADGLGRTQYADDFLSELAAAELAVALRRFKLDRGAYPDDPAALVPGYLPSLPIDPYTGRPPIYVRQGDGFLVQAFSREPPWPRTLDWNVSK